MGFHRLVWIWMGFISNMLFLLCTTSQRFWISVLQAVTIGMAVAGLAISLLSGFTLWAGAGAAAAPTAEDLRAEAVAYFGGSAAIVAAALFGYQLLKRLPYWRHQLEVQGSIP
jgi:hypothetical protein